MHTCTHPHCLLHLHRETASGMVNIQLLSWVPVRHDNSIKAQNLQELALHKVHT